MDFKKIIPKKVRINGEDEFFKSAVLALLMKVNNEWSFIFQKRSKNIRQGGEISFPGGRFDERYDKTFKDTALRETEEELLISRDEINVIGELDTIIAPMGALIRPFLATTSLNSLKDIKFNKDEVEYLFTVPLKYFIDTPPNEYQIVLKAHSKVIKKNGDIIDMFPAKKLGLPEKYHDIWGNIKQKVYLYNYNDEIIWGLTAKIIHNIVQNIKQ